MASGLNAAPKATLLTSYLSENLGLKQFLESKIPIVIKIRLMESIHSQLRRQLLARLNESSKDENYKTNEIQRELAGTASSEGINVTLGDASMSMCSPLSLQQRILDKQQVKIWLNEQIESNEEDLFELEKSLQKQKSYNQDLLAKITSLNEAYRSPRRNTPVATSQRKSYIQAIANFFR